MGRYASRWNPKDERADAYDYIFGSDSICNNALRCDNSCYLHITQKVAPSVW